MERLIQRALSILEKAIHLAHENNDYSYTAIDGDTKANIDIKLHSHFVHGLEPTGIPVFTEESTSKDFGSHSKYWLIDPLDGTLNYTCRFPIWGIAICLIDNGETKVSLVYSNLHKSIIYGSEHNVQIKNLSATKYKIHLSSHNNKVFLTGIPTGMQEGFSAIQKNTNEADKHRMLGSAVVSIVSLLLGQFYGYTEQGIFIWDVKAGIALAQWIGCQVELEEFGSNRLKVKVYKS